MAEERLQHAEESGEEIDIWSARDALVLKAFSLVLAPRLGLSPKCCHLKGHGGSKLAVQSVWEHLAHNRFVLRTCSLGRDTRILTTNGAIKSG